MMVLLAVVPFGYLIFSALNGNLLYSLSPTEVMDQKVILLRSPIRVEGKVVADSITWDPLLFSLGFKITDGKTVLPVSYKDLAPDNFEADRIVVVDATLTPEGTLEADRILVKCASRYEAKDSDFDKPESPN